MKKEIAGLALLFLVLWPFTVLAGGFATAGGAHVAGMESNQWGLEPLLYMIWGMIGGGVAFPILTMLFWGKLDGIRALAMLLSSIVVLPLGFVGGVAGYRYSVYDATKNREKDQVRAVEEGVRYMDYSQKLKDDPTIVLLQHWYHISGSDGFLKWRVYRDSLENPQVGYTPEEISTLIELERKNSILFRTLLRHPRLDVPTLGREYRLAFDEATHGSEEAGWRLIEILSLPQAKREWLLEVSSSGIADENGIFWKERLRTTISARLMSE